MVRNNRCFASTLPFASRLKTVYSKNGSTSEIFVHSATRKSCAIEGFTRWGLPARRNHGVVLIPEKWQDRWIGAGDSGKINYQFWKHSKAFASSPGNSTSAFDPRGISAIQPTYQQPFFGCDTPHFPNSSLTIPPQTLELHPKYFDELIYWIFSHFLELRLRRRVEKYYPPTSRIINYPGLSPKSWRGAEVPAMVPIHLSSLATHLLVPIDRKR
ncbi:hypothetical protein B0H13DRAFT_1884593 [Mycena leptocephala]|nr:hypothetical protein B0H13DRAFT_1884593 [Mycena leptocephala]